MSFTQNDIFLIEQELISIPNTLEGQLLAFLSNFSHINNLASSREIENIRQSLQSYWLVSGIAYLEHREIQTHTAIGILLSLLKDFTSKRLNNVLESKQLSGAYKQILLNEYIVFLDKITTLDLIDSTTFEGIKDTIADTKKELHQLKNSHQQLLSASTGGLIGKKSKTVIINLLKSDFLSLSFKALTVELMKIDLNEIEVDKIKRQIEHEKNKSKMNKEYILSLQKMNSREFSRFIVRLYIIVITKGIPQRLYSWEPKTDTFQFPPLSNTIIDSMIDFLKKAPYHSRGNEEKVNRQYIKTTIQSVFS